MPQNDMTPGECLLHGGYPIEARPYLEADLKRDPEKPAHWNNWGMMQKWLGNYPEAISAFRKALELAPAMLPTHHNLGMCYEETGRFREAIERYAFVCSWTIDENCMYALGSCLLREGKFDQAEVFWERARLAKFSAVIVPDIQVWRGESLEGEKILVTREGGYGDIFWLVRYLKSLKELGAHVTFLAPPTTVSLLKHFKWADAVIPSDAEFNVKDYDYQIPLWSLPWELRKIGAASMPMECGQYIEVRETLMGRVGLRGGLAPYSGEALTVFRKMRAIQPEYVDRFHKVPVSWTWLNADPAPEWCDASVTKGCDWLETAKIIAGLDFVVAVDSSVFHLAAALGKPVFLAVPLGSDWKFFREESTCSWYPSVRLYRNTDPVSFEGVVDRIVEDLCRVNNLTSYVMKNKEALCEART